MVAQRASSVEIKAVFTFALRRIGSNHSPSLHVGCQRIDHVVAESPIMAGDQSVWRVSDVSQNKPLTGFNVITEFLAIVRPTSQRRVARGFGKKKKIAKSETVIRFKDHEQDA